MDYNFKFANDINSIYIRLDDDIVYLEPTFLHKMFNFRLANEEPFIIYGNIINNAVISHFHQKNELLNINYHKTVSCECFDYIGTHDYMFCEEIHNKLVEYFENGTRLAWVILPDEECVLVYRKPKPSQLLQLEDSLDGEDVIPNFNLPLIELFQELSF
jgi:hypothetical protein